MRRWHTARALPRWPAARARLRAAFPAAFLAPLLAPLLALCLAALPCTAGAQQEGGSKQRAPGFSALPAASKVLLMPTDIELFSISGGGVVEPRADWTEAAARHFRAALVARKHSLGVVTVDLPEREAEAFEEINALHGAIARAIAIHHFGPPGLALPTKAGRLDWSLGEAVRPLREKTGADYALFSWVRDSYASSERVAAMVVLALLGVGAGGGSQAGYVSLVDLRDGRVLWFNRLSRASGDLREADKAGETIEALLADFPGAK